MVKVIVLNELGFFPATVTCIMASAEDDLDIAGFDLLTASHHEYAIRNKTDHIDVARSGKFLHKAANLPVSVLEKMQ
ncbi:hypothetical protein QA635_33015 [Bradyrhizobium brasilense]|uniref:hypothetical protein n=1 Tax=Bradyrhizobium brasilense TaxID=1419277 RepID=UPI0024B162B2|nr:hypothetical protein [Bradyrhizobium australafricanum]WFU31342.1 hypothetical protein QA635_33015 [Bradyrhizobium australafricanum]